MVNFKYYLNNSTIKMKWSNCMISSSWIWINYGIFVNIFSKFLDVRHNKLTVTVRNKMLAKT